jgi:hypothetical protein
MKITALTTPTERSGWPIATLTILLAVLCALAVVVAITTTGCDQTPIPISPTPGNVCGVGAWQECPDHGCCLAYTEECTLRHECRYVGEGPLFGASKDGGAAVQPELSPAEVRARGGVR